MADDSALRIAASAGLLLGSMFFVAAEYAIVGCRRTKLESLAKRGNSRAKAVIKELENVPRLLAACQVCITVCNVGIGAITEPFVTGILGSFLTPLIGRGGSSAISIVLVTTVLVGLGELFPKYMALERADRFTLSTTLPLKWIAIALAPLIWLIQVLGGGAAMLFGTNVNKLSKSSVAKEELLLLVNAGGAEGILDVEHAGYVSRALQLDKLVARDVMIHRLDIKWLDINLPVEEFADQVALIPHSRIPVCNADIDELVGILYLTDFYNYMRSGTTQLSDVVRKPVVVPENVSLDKIVERMRNDRTQILIVLDEYGGTSGLITLEDVVEEIFGELEDYSEAQRPPIEVQPGGRVSARADVRFDEVVSKLRLSMDEEPATDTLATMMVEALGRMPKMGDAVESSLGTLRVENMARRRVTRVSIQLLPAWQELVSKAAATV